MCSANQLTGFYSRATLALNRLIHYQINMINMTRLLYRICLTGKSDENDYLYFQNT